VEGLKENLLSISQLCDDDLVVQFSKKECNIFDNNGKWLMGGERTSDNYYGIPGLSSDSQIICNKATIDESELWHQRLGHLNFTNMFKIANKEVVKDLPKMKDTRKGVCGPCQLGKHTRAAHKKTSTFVQKNSMEQNCPIMRIRSDHGREFENARFEEYCHSYGIQQEFSSPITPQQNGVVERKNRVL
jgi:hypothetical protein